MRYFAPQQMAEPWKSATPFFQTDIAGSARSLPLALFGIAIALRWLSG